MMMAYPPDDSKGTYTALFWAIFNSGAVAGGAVTFGVNFDISTEQAAPSATTFVVFFLVMLVGSILCLALVCPEDVVRSDGRRVLVRVRRRISHHITPHKYSEYRPRLHACLSARDWMLCWFPWTQNCLCTHWKITSVPCIARVGNM